MCGRNGNKWHNISLICGRANTCRYICDKSCGSCPGNGWAQDLPRAFQWHSSVFCHHFARYFAVNFVVRNVHILSGTLPFFCKYFAATSASILLQPSIVLCCNFDTKIARTLGQNFFKMIRAILQIKNKVFCCLVCYNVISVFCLLISNKFFFDIVDYLESSV